MIFLCFLTMAVASQIFTDEEQLDEYWNIEDYKGEWSWQLYAKDIWSADIELFIDVYDEAVCGDRNRDYKNQYSNLGKLTTVLDQFVNLLKDFPWEK